MEAIVTKAGEMSLERLLTEVQKVRGLNSQIKHIKEELIPTIDAWLKVANAARPTSPAECLAVDQLLFVRDTLSDLLDGIETRKLITTTTDHAHYSFKKVLKKLLSPSLNPIICKFRDARDIKAAIEGLDRVARPHSLLGSMFRPPFGTLTSPMKATCIETVPYSSEVVIGRDVDRDNVIRLLLESSCGREHFSVVTIVGIPGIGKTTLAQYVFTNQRVQNHFDLTLWVYVPQELIVNDVVRKMVESATHEDISATAQLVELQHRLLPIISRKKCLLVLDNVWNRSNLHWNWEALIKQLGFGGHGSMVLTTTRSPNVANTIGTVASYVLGDLEGDDSWCLFRSHAFSQGQEPGPLQAIGYEIVRKCPKVPLVLRSVGCHLRVKQTFSYWEEFRDKLDDLSLYGEVPGVMETLKLTYDDLDVWLKRCFACCSLFPKGYNFEENELIYLWIALNLVEPPSGNQSFSDLARGYLLRLIEEGLLVDKEIWVGKCWVKMHDVIHDLALSIAGPEYKMVDSESCEFNERIRHVSFGPNVELSGNNLCSSLFKFKNQMQSLLLLPRKHNSRSLKLKLEGALKFECLRVLGVPYTGLEEVPREIGKLKHLKYLDLSDNSLIKKLPRSITQLVNLVFLKLTKCENLAELPSDLNKLQKLIHLDLHDCSNLRKLPRGITELVKLRELYLAGCRNLRHMPLRLGNMTGLHQLDLFVAKGKSSMSTNRNDPNASGDNVDDNDDVDDDEVGGLAELNSLNDLEGELEIKVRGSLLSGSEARAANLQAKKKLTTLRIKFFGKSNRDNHELMLEGFQPHANLRELEIHYYRGERLPSWIDEGGYNLRNLEEIMIYGWKGRRCVGSIGRLPRLKVLMIHFCENLEYVESSRGRCSSDDMVNVDDDADPSAPSVAPLFPSLEVLYLRLLPELKGWQSMSSNNECFLLSAFPKLKTLELYDVGLEFFPEEFRGFPSLESFDIQKCVNLKELPEWIDTLTSLKELSINECPELTTLPKQMAKLSNLEELSIRGCRKVKGVTTGEDGLPIPRFPKLKELHLYGLGIEFVPQVFQGVTSLRNLQISECEQLQEIPEWIDTLTSLYYLRIAWSPKLTSLPKQIANLAKLERLTIYKCSSQLKERCQKPTGEDCYIIQHLPHVDIQ